jgi:hypothetical protein
MAVDDAFTITLVHCDGPDGSTFIVDESGKTWTANNNAQLDTDFYRMGSAALALAGNGDCLYGNGHSALGLGTSDYAIELWFYLAATPSTVISVFDWRPLSTEGLYPHLYLYHTDMKLYYWVGGTNRISGSTVLVTGKWYHIAVVRSSGSTKLYLNGVQEGSSYSDSNDYLISANRPVFGGSGKDFGSYCLTGRIDEIRISKDTPRWTSGFTPQHYNYGESNPVDDEYTVSLMHNAGDNGSRTFYDSAGPLWVPYQNVQISNAHTKFAPFNAYFSDGTLDLLYGEGSSRFAFGTGDFCIEFWLYKTAWTGSTELLYDFRPQSSQGYYPTLYLAPDHTLYYYANSVNLITGPVLSLNTWYHIAVTRASGNTRLFVNGVQQGSTYADSSNYGVGANRPNIMNGYNGSYSAQGWMTEIRVSKGVARFTSNFPPPTEAYGPATLQERFLHPILSVGA